MPSKWIQHVKAVAREQNIPYKEALKVASMTYQKKEKPVKSEGGNPWLIHVSEYRRENPSLPYKQVLINAAQTYQKKSKGGALSGGELKGGVNPMAVAEGVQTVIKMLGETGILEGSKRSINSLAKRLEEQLAKPEYFALRDLSTNVLHQKVRALKDTEFFLKQNESRFLPWRVRHIKFKINALKNEIESIVNRIMSLTDFVDRNKKDVEADYKQEVKEVNRDIEKEIKNADKEAVKEEKKEKVDDEYKKLVKEADSLVGAGLRAGGCCGSGKRTTKKK